MNHQRKRTPFARVLDELENRYSNFDGQGYEYDYIEGAPPEEAARLYQADPYQIIVQNTSTTDTYKALLFGHDRFLLDVNFGNPEAIKITLGQPGLRYVELLQQSALKPFATQFMRIESKNSLQVSKFITVTQYEANGNMFRRSMNMQQYKSAYQNQNTMLDAPINEYVDGSTVWEVDIEPATTVYYTIFPMFKVDTSGTLRGYEPIKSFAPARVNTGGMISLPAALPAATGIKRAA